MSPSCIWEPCHTSQGQLYSFSGSQFPHLKNGQDTIYLAELLEDSGQKTQGVVLEFTGAIGRPGDTEGEEMEQEESTDQF